MNYSTEPVNPAEMGIKDPQPSLQSVAVMGSTGSIGQSTLDIIAGHRERFSVFALAARRNVKLLAEQCQIHQPRYAAIADESRAGQLSDLLKTCGCQTEVVAGPAALDTLAADTAVDTVVAAIVGAAGLPSTMAAVQAGKKVLLANKETLVVAGELFVRAVRESGAQLLPIDSEHNAIFQCLPDTQGLGCADRSAAVDSLARHGIRKLLLTGSGGPFRETPLAELSAVTPEQAVAHPNWSMGAKISVDSATMMNKGLELIEACWLFACEPQRIEIVIHPQSIIHSMVEYLDGSVLAQLGSPDMRTPIAHALAWPERVEAGVTALDWTSMGQLSFEAPDYVKFPALQLARDVAAAGGSLAVGMNAANEIAVEAFLQRRIGYLDIVRIAQQCVEKMPTQEPESIAQLQELDLNARALAEQLIQAMGR